ncbi:prephenate dehydrogenase [Desulfitobacterium metallireducens]|uniref:Prephenate dehydrogenase n=1 Tax=Desulfitobacterium metallireducens DSM 15288 TaxID=871968 RepID=W0E8V6_9FIRM|nr:prephenate dehydrogenase/arogenate dehydrogenase family protein [Desulfitobacterium metallireducens]AHF07290.1 prephenate dehydrogenase [Desulfitobacterium metallireducens DSM 15288]
MDDDFFSPGWRGERRPQAWVIGLGLIGGSWAATLSHLGWKVTALDTQPESLRWAEHQNWIQAGQTEWPEKIEADLVILALPIHLLNEGLEHVLERVCEGAIITDVGSVKTEVCQSDIQRRHVYFIGGHPMTGSEKSGVQAAHAELFRNFPYVLVPRATSPQPVVDKLEALLHQIGAKVVLRTPEEHDRQVALVSHLPHLFAVALTLAILEESPNETSSIELAGRSFREMTRIADSSPEMWQEILIRNASAVLASLDVWQGKLDEIRSWLEEKNGDEIAGAFRKAHAVRQGLGG